MVLSKNEKVFLIYFFPLFGLKLLDITSESFILMMVGFICFLFSLNHIYNSQYGKKVFNIFTILLLYSAILVITSGKQAIFFTVLMLILMFRVNMNRIVYKYLFVYGAIFLLFFMLYSYLKGSAEITTRYVNGNWVEMIKRNNLLFVSYMAILCLFLLVHRKNICGLHLMSITILNYIMFVFVGSRTGLIVSLFLSFLLVSFKYNNVRKNFFVKWLCVLSPLYCMLFCIYTGVFYNKHSWLLILDMILQGRICQNSLFMHRYMILPFGQRIVEGSDVGGAFLNLDCAYIDFLLCEGLIFSIMWIIVSILVIKYFYDRSRMVEVSIIVIYAFYGVTETFLPNCFLNVSLFLYGEWLYKKLNVRQEFRTIHLIKHKGPPKYS